MDNALERKPLPAACDARSMCGCGLSGRFPFCDGTQMISKSHVEGALVSCGAAAQSVPAIAKAKIA